MKLELLDRAKVKRLRLALNLSMDEAAELCGLCHRSEWWRIEAGTFKRHGITLHMLARIAMTLRTQPRLLLLDIPVSNFKRKAA